MVKSIFQLVLIIVISQSCVVYNKTSVPLNHAVNQGKVKITATSGQIYQFTNIVLIDSVYYGTGRQYINQFNYISTEGARTLLDSTMYQAIYLKDAKKSKSRTVWFVIGVSIPVAYLTLGFLFFLFSGV